MNLDEKLAKWTLENAAAMPASTTQKDWVGTPYVEVLPGYLVYNEDVQDIEKMDKLRARAAAAPRSALADVDGMVEHFSGGSWCTFLADYTLVARSSSTPPPVLDASWSTEEHSAVEKTFHEAVRLRQAAARQEA